MQPQCDEEGEEDCPSDQLKSVVSEAEADDLEYPAIDTGSVACTKRSVERDATVMENVRNEMDILTDASEDLQPTVARNTINRITIAKLVRDDALLHFLRNRVQIKNTITSLHPPVSDIAVAGSLHKQICPIKQTVADPI